MTSRCLIPVILVLAAQFASAQTAAEVLAASGLKNAVVAHLAASDGQLDADLASAGNFVVHALSLTNTGRDAVRARLFGAGVYGMAFAETYPDQTKLPYPDRFVNLLVADLDALGTKGPSVTEINRVMAPRGIVYTRSGGSWQKREIAMPAGMDGYSHWFGDVTQTGSNKDTYCAPPTTVKWISGVANPRTPGEGGSSIGSGSMSGFRADNGKIAYNVIELWKTDWSGKDKSAGSQFVIRDAFSGVPNLWLPKPDNGAALDIGNTRFSTVFKDGYVYTTLSKTSYVSKIDPSTGQALVTFDKGFKPDYFGAWNSANQNPDVVLSLVYQGKLFQVKDSSLRVLDINNGNLLQSYNEQQGRIYFPVIAPEENALFLVVHDGLSINTGGGAHMRFPCVGPVKGILKLNLQTLKEERRSAAPHQLINRFAYMSEKRLLCGFYSARGDGTGYLPSAGVDPAVFTMNAQTGALVWKINGIADPWYSGSRKDFSWKGSKIHMVVWNGRIWAEELMFEAADGKLDAANYKVPYNARCVLPIASGNYYSNGFSEFFNKNEQNTSGAYKRYSRYAYRPTCANPVVPAFGQWYCNPNDCGCTKSKMDGFFGMAYEDRMDPLPDAGRLEAGGGGSPAVFSAAPLPGKNLDLYVDQRSTNFAYNKDSIPASIQGGDLLFVPVAWGHRVEARRNGANVWTFVAGGRIGPGMAYANGKLYFGSHDGYVYCVNGSDGALLWRFLAAPNLRKMYAYGQLESAWPVFGVVLYSDQVAFCAGRHAELDGGMWVYSLNANTGAVKWKVGVSIDNFRVTGCNTACGVENQAMTFDGTNLVLDRLIFNPDSPANYTQGKYSPITVSARLKHRNRFAKPALLGNVMIGSKSLTVVVPQSGRHDISLYGAAGERVYNCVAEGPNYYNIGTRDLAQGKYVLSVKSGARTESRAVNLIR